VNRHRVEGREQDRLDTLGDQLDAIEKALTIHAGA